MPLEIAILGSCVTGGPLGLAAGSTFKIVAYVARTSFVSMMSSPLKFDADMIRPMRPSELRWMEGDFTRSSLSMLDRKFDYLVIDFVEETVNLRQIGTSFVLETGHVRQSGVLEQFQLGPLLRRADKAVTRRWEEACGAFCSGPLARVPQDRIILHRGLLASCYKDGTEIRQFENGPAAQVRVLNPVLETYYAYFQGLVPGAHVIDISPDLRIADANHRSGLSPFHYIPEYDRAFLGRFEAITKTSV
jgi:hypothetical protein